MSEDDIIINDTPWNMAMQTVSHFKEINILFKNPMGGGDAASILGSLPETITINKNIFFVNETSINF